MTTPDDRTVYTSESVPSHVPTQTPQEPNVAKLEETRTTTFDSTDDDSEQDG